MGTDVHIIAQVKEDGKWLTVGDHYNYVIIDPGRNYEFFSCLANVRMASPFGVVAPRRGLPPEIESQIDTRKDRNRFEGRYLGDHHYSWLLLSELQDYYNKHKDKPLFKLPECTLVTETRFEEFIESLEDVAQDYGVATDCVRIVFGFDS